MTDHSRIEAKKGVASVVAPAIMVTKEPKVTIVKKPVYKTARLIVNVETGQVVLVDEFNDKIVAKTYKRLSNEAGKKGFTNLKFGKVAMPFRNHKVIKGVVYRTLTTVAVAEFAIMLSK